MRADLGFLAVKYLHMTLVINPVVMAFRHACSYLPRLKALPAGQYHIVPLCSRVPVDNLPKVTPQQCQPGVKPAASRLHV